MVVFKSKSGSNTVLLISDTGLYNVPVTWYNVHAVVFFGGGVPIKSSRSERQFLKWWLITRINLLGPVQHSTRAAGQAARAGVAGGGQDTRPRYSIVPFNPNISGTTSPVVIVWISAFECWHGIWKHIRLLAYSRPFFVRLLPCRGSRSVIILTNPDRYPV